MQTKKDLRDIRISDADLLTLARTIYGEARGEPQLGKEAVAHVVLNRFLAGQKQQRRARQYGASIEEVCRKPWQFSCWNENDPNRARILEAQWNDPDLLDCLIAAADVIGGRAEGMGDPTLGATHYLAKGLTPARWALGKTPCIGIGGHNFYNDID